MNEKQVSKIPGLGFGFSASVDGITFMFTGNTDAVRLAARDLVHGLGVLWQVDARINHVSELMKMKGRTFLEGQAQINLVLCDLKAFDRLVILFRYVRDLGFSLPDFKSLRYLASDTPYEIQWQYPKTDDSQQEGIKQGYASTLYAYLAAVNDCANESSEPLCIKPYLLKFNRCFWLESELQEDAQKRVEAKSAPRDTTTFFSGAGSSNDVDDNQSAISLIDRDMEFILSEISVMIMSHPLNPMKESSTGDAYCCITNFRFIRGKHPEYDIQADTNQIFPLIRPEDRPRFIELAEEYDRLSEQQREMMPKTEPQKGWFSSCSML